MHVLAGQRGVHGQLQLLAAGDGLALPATVGELGVAVADATHLELVTRGERHGVARAVPVDQVVLEGVGEAGARPPLHAPVHRAHHLRLLAQASDCARLVPAAAVAVLVHVEVGGQRGEVHRRPQPEELGDLHRRSGGGLLADGADAPRPVARTPHHVGRDVVAYTVHLHPAAPRAELGEARVVEERAHARPLEEVGLLDRGRPPVELERRAQPLLGCVDRQAQALQRLDHFHHDRAEGGGVAPVERRPLAAEHAVLHTVLHHAERGVGHVAVGVQPHRRAEVQPAVAGVAVEEVTVVLVDVARRAVGDGHGGLVDGEVVEAGQHAANRSHCGVWAYDAARP